MLVDIDGVLNACTWRSDNLVKATGWSEWRNVKVAGYPILAAEAVLDFVRKVHDEELAEVRWLTTWEMGDLVLTDLAPALGLPAFPIAGRAKDHPGKWSDHSHWWKFEVVQQIAEEDARRIVWVDDDLSYAREAHQWVADRGDRILGVAPVTEFGLTQSDIATIGAFLAGDPAQSCCQGPA